MDSAKASWLTVLLPDSNNNSLPSHASPAPVVICLCLIGRCHLGGQMSGEEEKSEKLEWDLREDQNVTSFSKSPLTQLLPVSCAPLARLCTSSLCICLIPSLFLSPVCVPLSLCNFSLSVSLSFNLSPHLVYLHFRTLLLLFFAEHP